MLSGQWLTDQSGEDKERPRINRKYGKVLGELHR